MTQITSNDSLNDSYEAPPDQAMAGLGDGPEDSPRDDAGNSSGQHPSPFPRLSQKSWGLLLGGAVLLTIGTWGVLQLTRSSDSPEAAVVPTILVENQAIQAQPMAKTLDLSGTLRPIDQATLSTRVMGRITQLSLESGDRFRKGDVLAQIDVMDMTAQTSQAQSGVTQAQAEVARSQATLSQLESQKLEAQAALRLTQINQSRMVQLQAEGAVSQSQLDQANTALEEARARVAQTEAGSRQAQAAIDQSLAAVNQAKSGVTSAAASESYGTILAPFDGVVVQKLAYEGEMAAPGTALIKVENPDRLQLEISVPEENLRFVRVGQPVQVRVEALNQTIKASIGQIVPAADPSSRSFLVKIPLNNPGRLISGMFGRITLPLAGTQETMLIPANALIQRGQLQGVYVIETRGSQATAALRWVKTGPQRDGQVEIVSGLMAGDRIITSNISQLSDGHPIARRD